MSVHPCLTYRDVRGAMAWLKAAFAIDGQALAAQGARHDDPLDHALLTIESGTILVESERPEQLHGPHAGRGWVYVTITDADAHYQRARQAGAQVYGEPHDYGGGHRGYSARDLEGNLWTFGTAQPLITPACDPAARTNRQRAAAPHRSWIIVIDLSRKRAECLPRQARL
jgi:uncharacterized glyoxalase superfamily protein PhnB